VTRLRTFLSRLWALVRSRQMDRDIDDEIASHLAEAADEYIEQGLSPEDAHWAALRSFGGVTQTKELYRQVRSFMWLDDLRQDLRHTARTLVKNPMFTLIVIINIANLLLARAAGHARDVGIRLSLGATTGRLIRQSLTESFMLASLGAAFGLLFGGWASRYLALQVLGTSQQLPVVFTLDERVLTFAVVVSLATAAACGLGSALRAVRLARPAILGAHQRQALGHATTRGMRALVVGQLALSVVLVVAAILLGQTLINFMRIDPGFSKDHLLTASFDPITSGYAADRMPSLGRRLVEAARAVPGVASAAVARCGLVAGCSSSSAFRVEAAGEIGIFHENWVTPRYFSTVGIPLISGRAFDERDTEHGPRVAIINESIARRYFSGHNPIGRRLGFPQPDTEIIGVVRDARTQTLREPAVPMVYRPLDQKAVNLFTPLTNLDVRVSGDPRRAVTAIRDTIRRAEPDLLLGDVGPMSERLARDLSRERLVAYLALSFGGLAWLLASLGLYGVLSYGVARRTQEIGVRIALGARRSQVMRVVLGQSMRMTITGVALGLFGATAGARYLAALLFGVAPVDPGTFVGVSLAFSVLTTLAAYVPARRATRVDPLTALRSE
jgi:predicted permease